MGVHLSQGYSVCREHSRIRSQWLKLWPELNWEREELCVIPGSQATGTFTPCYRNDPSPGD